MVICHIITALDHGGAEILLKNVANELVKRNEVHVLCLKNRTKILREFSPSVKVEVVGLGLGTVLRIRKSLKKIKPEVVHTHLGHADFLGHLATLGLEVRRLCTMHNIWFKKSWVDYLFFGLYFIYFNILFRKSIVISISRSVWSHVHKVYRLGESRNFYLPNTIGGAPSNASKQEMRERLGISPSCFVLVFVGRFTKQKNLPFLICAFSELVQSGRDFHLLMVGDGEQRAELENLVRSNSLAERVSMVGVVDNVNDYIKCADLLVLPSIFEGFGLVVLEAFREGVPVLASNIEGPKELVEDGVDGVLFEVNSVVGFVGSLFELYDDRERLGEMSRNAKAKFLKHGTMADYVSFCEGLYRMKQ